MKKESIKSIQDGLLLGIDIGAISSDVVLLDCHHNIIYSNYARIKGKAIETVYNQLQELSLHFPLQKVKIAAATGAGARLLASILNIPYINEVSSQAAAICHLYSHLDKATLIEMGGQDVKLLFLKNTGNGLSLEEFTLNSLCAAGTGSFLDQQAERLGVSIEDEFGTLALKAKNIPTLAGRCSVFAKSDMIHLQQVATPVEEIIAGLCFAVARNLKGNLLKGKDFFRPVIFTGGVAANLGIRRAIKETWQLAEEELIVPKEHFFTGAIGAVLLAKNEIASLDIDVLKNYLSSRALNQKQEVPSLEPLSQPIHYYAQKRSRSEVNKQCDGKINGYLGLDVGSISTKAVVIDDEHNVIAKVYLMTAGKPLDAVINVLQQLSSQLDERVEIKGAATTGSGRYLTGDIIGADVVINEITAQAKGAMLIYPEVDTIFEIGGQDSKYIAIKDGVVVDFEMNHACAAGTGSFLEEQAAKLGISVKNEFSEMAFKSSAPIKIGERCSVFMEADLLEYQQQGACLNDLVAGLAYSIAINYLNRVVGRRQLGNHICFQGGTAFNKAVWAAFEKVTGKPIVVPEHHEVTGAIGAALIAHNFMQDKISKDPNANTLFKGFKNLINTKYAVDTFTCEYCPNTCEVKKVAVDTDKTLYYGSRCDRYNLNKKQAIKKKPNLFKWQYNTLMEFATKELPHKAKRSEKIGIPLALINWHYLPLFSTFFRVLGFETIISAPTTKAIVKQGIEAVTAEFCFPIKVASGHIINLVEQGVDYIFLPSVVSMEVSYSTNKTLKLCPYVQSFPYQIKTLLADKFNEKRVISTPLYLNSPNDRKSAFLKIANSFGISKKDANYALSYAIEKQKEFEEVISKKGEEVLCSKGDNERIFVLIGRSYNSYDEQINLHIADKLSSLGEIIIPMEMLPLDKAEITFKEIHSNVYWGSGQKILRAAEIIRSNDKLFAIYLSNFSCGPDSFLITFFRKIMGTKPCLFLELDEHSADAGLVTRLEAFLDSLKHNTTYSSYDVKPNRANRSVSTKSRKIFIPYMGDCSYGIAAAIRAYGRDADVLPSANEKGLLLGRKFTTGKECLPCAITLGDMLTTILQKEINRQEIAFFMPATSGPCRFGLYNCLHRMVLEDAGFDDVAIISPNQDTSFYREIGNLVDGNYLQFAVDVWSAVVGIDLLLKTYRRVRAFARKKQEVDTIYLQCLKKWLLAVESKNSIMQKKKLISNFAEDFSKIELDWSVSKPCIGIVGEIYVRNHPFANNNIIEKLEELGAICSLASVAEWIYYTNFTRSRRARRSSMSLYVVNLLIDRVERKIEKIFAEPLEIKFGKLAEPEITKVLDCARPYLHDSFEGEAILSIGKTLEFYHSNHSGVINVMPFSCMPSTVVSSLTSRISKDLKGFPILNLHFDGNEDVSFRTRLEAFFEQCVTREQSLLTARELFQLNNQKS